MIFKKILKGTDLAFDFTLEKMHYTPGEIVRGTLSINTEKDSKARKLVLLVEGKESSSITVTERAVLVTDEIQHQKLTAKLMSSSQRTFRIYSNNL